MRKVILVFLFLLSIIGLGGCFPTDNGKITVYASVYPIYDFASKIGGDKVAVHPVVDFGIEPHHYDPDATIIVKLAKADLFIYNGAGMEFWVDKIIEQLPQNGPKIIRATDGIELLDGHHHHHHEEDEECDDQDDITKIKDPHVWLDPMNVKKMMENIKNALIEIDPTNEDYYEENFNHYSEKLNELDQRYLEEINRFDRNIRKIIVSHEAFNYLCERYGIEQWAIEGLSRESEPDPSQIVNAINYAKNNNIGVIFYEQSVGSKVAESIASQIGGIADKLNPIEAISKEDHRKGVEYFTIMENNLSALVNSFQVTENLINQKKTVTK